MLGENRVAIGRYWLVVILLAVIILGAFLVYLGRPVNQGGSTTLSSSSSGQSTVKGIVAGIVTVGPSQPSCPASQSCTVDITGYSLQFSSECPNPPTSCSTQTYSAVVSPSGHYSILLSPGNYTIVGLSPSCSWPGCSSAFPRQVTVEPGNQLIVNVDVDTGIR